MIRMPPPPGRREPATQTRAVQASRRAWMTNRYRVPLCATHCSSTHAGPETITSSTRLRAAPSGHCPRRASQPSREPLPARPEALLEAAVGGAVVADGVVQVVREVLLRGDPVGLVVGVDVPLAVAEPLGPGVAAPPQVGGDDAAPPRAHVGDRLVDAEVCRVGLRRHGVVHDRLGEDDPRLGHADLGDRVHRRDGGLQGGRVAHPDVLAGGDDDAAGDEAGVLPRLEHPGQVVQGGVDVAAAHRLDERARDVVVLVAGAVVADGRLRDGLLDVGQGDLDGVVGQAAGGLGVEGDPGRGLEGGQGPPRVAAGDPHEVVGGVGGRVCAPSKPRSSVSAAASRSRDLLVGQRLERDEHRTRQQRRDDAERRVLGRRGDEDDGAVLDAGEQGVLLGLGEAVDLVEEEHGLAGVEVALADGRLHDRADVLDAGRDGRQLDEAAVGRGRDEVGERRLAGARAAPRGSRTTVRPRRPSPR